MGDRRAELTDLVFKNLTAQTGLTSPGNRARWTFGWPLNNREESPSLTG